MSGLKPACLTDKFENMFYCFWVCQESCEGSGSPSQGVEHLPAVTFIYGARKEEVVDSFMCVLTRWTNGGVSTFRSVEMFVKGCVAGM